jgi:vacuolar-type H+-ATPase subunit I/STV1
MDSLQDSETKEMEELISKFVGLGLNDSEARAAAVLHLVKTADLSDEERTALFAPEKVEVKDEKLEQDYAQLVKDHAQLKEELESLKASNEKADEAVEVKDADENVEESTKKTATEVVEDAATEEAEAKTEAVETEVAELKDSDEQETKVVDTVEKIDNPSASVTDAVNNQSEVAELTDYQRQKVNRYKHIRDSQSEEAAGAFISMLKRSNRLPGDFDVTPHLK